MAFGLLALYLLFWPVPIHPYAWQPGPDPGQTGPYVPNSDLETARVVGLTRHQGPKDLAIVYQGPEDLAIGPDEWLLHGRDDRHRERSRRHHSHRPRPE